MTKSEAHGFRVRPRRSAPEMMEEKLVLVGEGALASPKGDQPPCALTVGLGASPCGFQPFCCASIWRK